MTGQTSYLDDDGVYWILDPAQLTTLISPRRHDIVDRLVASGALSIKELAATIGAEPPALYHHIRKLLAVGLVIEAGSRVVSRKREQLYAAPGKRMRLSRALGDPRNRDLFIQITASLSRQMDRDFRRGSETASAITQGPTKTLGFSRLIGAPGPSGMAAINRKLEEIAEILWNSSEDGGEVVCLSWVLAPIETGAGGD
jgi:DNA-binding transcriptional ArsR family regulator